jgi:NAD+ kinase
VYLVKRVGVLYHPLNRSAAPLAEELAAFLGSRGVTAWLCSAWDEAEARCRLDSTDLVLTIGGDGTILRAAQLTARLSVPVTGVNLGRLGFLTELGPQDVRDGLAAIAAGEGWLDERTMIDVRLALPGGGESQTFLALNDVVAARGEIARMIWVDASINGEAFSAYKADGVIVATATGSTGYALSAGGPILHPQSRELVLVPILPHLSFAYPLVLPDSSAVSLSIGALHPATLSIDGHINRALPDGASLTVKESQHKTRFLRVQPRDYFYRSLEERLKGK